MMVVGGSVSFLQHWDLNKFTKDFVLANIIKARKSAKAAN